MRATVRSQEAGRLHAAVWFGEPYESACLRLDMGRKGWHSLGAGLRFGGGDHDDLGLSVSLWWFSLYLTLERATPWSWRRASYAWAQRLAERLGPRNYASDLDPFEGRETGFSFHDGTLWVWLWKNRDCWRSEDTPRWERRRGWIRGHLPWNCAGWEWTFHIEDWLIGSATYEKEEAWTEPGVVVMPEGKYPATVTLRRVRWNRRWWNGRWWWRGEVEVPSGVPIPGKGENSWDCDDDAIYGTTFAVEEGAPTARDLLDRVAMSALQTRQKYSTLGWCPVAKMEAR